jgi:hypothetical protein
MCVFRAPLWANVLRREETSSSDASGALDVQMAPQDARAWALGVSVALAPPPAHFEQLLAHDG